MYWSARYYIQVQQRAQENRKRIEQILKEEEEQGYMPSEEIKRIEQELCDKKTQDKEKRMLHVRSY